MTQMDRMLRTCGRDWISSIECGLLLHSILFGLSIAKYVLACLLFLSNIIQEF